MHTLQDESRSKSGYPATVNLVRTKRRDKLDAAVAHAIFSKLANTVRVADRRAYKGNDQMARALRVDMRTSQDDAPGSGIFKNSGAARRPHKEINRLWRVTPARNPQNMVVLNFEDGEILATFPIGADTNVA
jgi:hypothetical protein